MKLTNNRKASIAAFVACLLIVASIFVYNKSTGETVRDDVTYIQQTEKNKSQAQSKLSQFDKKYFILRNATIYKDKRCPKYLSTKFVFTYLVYKKGEYKLRIKTQYSGQLWLLIKKVEFISDKEIVALSGEFERGEEGTRIWESLDIVLKGDIVNILERVLQSENVKVRYSGMSGSEERELSSKEKSIMLKTIFIYKNI